MLDKEQKMKEVYYQIRIDKELKERFTSFCKKNGYNSSAITRQLIERWLAEKDNKDNEK